MERSIKVVDFTHGKKDSDNVNTNIPFKKNFAEAKTIQSANVIIASYTDKNITDLAKLENKTNVLESDLNNLNNKTNVLEANVSNLNNETNVLKADVTNLKSEINLKADKTDIPTKTSDLTNDSNYITASYHDASKQDVLVSGTNIKTINNQDILGSGNIEVESSAVWGSITGDLHNQQDLHNALQTKADLTDIPTKTSELFNDSGYITNEYHDATKQDVINNLGVINNNLKFSLNEIVVGEYLNKPLYRKVIEATVNGNANLTTKLSDLGITGQDIVLINLGKSIAKYGAAPNFGWSPVSYYISGSDSSVVYINTVGSLVIKNNTGGSRDYKVVLEYTKIADSEVL